VVHKARPKRTSRPAKATISRIGLKAAAISDATTVPEEHTLQIGAAEAASCVEKVGAVEAQGAFITASMQILVTDMTSKND
jgi:hypothetical protein